MKYEHIYNLFGITIQLTTNAVTVNSEAELFLGEHEINRGGAPDYTLVFDNSPSESYRGYPDLTLRSGQDYLIVERGSRVFLSTGEGIACFNAQTRTCHAYIMPKFHGQNYIGSVPLLNLTLVMVMFMAGFLPLHAAAVQHKGRLIVLAGEKGAGKSTLVLKLHQRGLPLICDDLLYIKNDGGYLVAGGHLQPLKFIAKDADPLLVNYREIIGLTKIPGKKLFPSEQFNPHARNSLYPLDAIIFLQRPTQGVSATLWPNRQAEAIYHLVGDAPMLNTPEYRARALEFVCGAGPCQLYLAQTSLNPDDLVSEILIALEHSPTPSVFTQTMKAEQCSLPWKTVPYPRCRSWKTFSSGQTSGLCSPDLALDRWVPWLEKLTSFLATSSATEINYLSLLSTGRSTYRINGADGAPLFVKRYPSASLVHLPSPDGLSLGNHPWDAFCRNLELWQKNIPVPKPLVFMETSSGTTETACYVITRFLEGSYSLLDFTFEHLCCRPVAQTTLRKWIETIVASIIHFHRIGYSHGDLHQLNLMVRCVEPGSNLEIFFTDFDMCKSGTESSPYSDQLLDLATLGASLYRVLPDHLLAKGLVQYFAAFAVKSAQREQCMQTIRQNYRLILDRDEQSSKNVEDFYFTAALSCLDKKGNSS